MKKVREIEFYECMSCEKRIKAKEYENYGQVKAGYNARCSCTNSDFSSWKMIYKNPKASEIIKESCCGNLLPIEKDKLVEMVEALEAHQAENVRLSKQLDNAIAEIQSRPKR